MMIDNKKKIKEYKGIEQAQTNNFEGLFDTFKYRLGNKIIEKRDLPKGIGSPKFYFEYVTFSAGNNWRPSISIPGSWSSVIGIYNINTTGSIGVYDGTNQYFSQQGYSTSSNFFMAGYYSPGGTQSQRIAKASKEGGKLVLDCTQFRSTSTTYAVNMLFIYF